MLDPLPASKYIELGEHVYLMQNRVETIRGPDLAGILARFIALLEECGFTSAKNAVSPLTVLNYPILPGNQLLNPGSVTHISAAMRSAVNVMYNQAAAMKTVVLKESEASAKLRDLPKHRGLTTSQQHLWEETLRCFETGANRAAAVMGWNLAYDCMRRWIFDNVLDFNTRLTTRYPSLAPLTKYEDFFLKDAPDESELLKVAGFAPPGQKPIIGGEIYDHLIAYLRQRNKYAHASGVIPSAEQVAGYIDHLIDIISTAPFA
ncbi:MAG TPA: hypothetical protein VK395_12735 [Gemmataceae bacterium]|nr:hypothetical protein [Gemmataceae bacterium]